MEKTDREFSSILPILQEIKKNKVQVIFGVLPLELTVGNREGDPVLLCRRWFSFLVLASG